MASVIKSLKKLYKKMGGTNTKGINTVDGMVDKIAEKYEAANSSGEAAVQSVFNITIIHDDENSRSELDKTWSEIRDAFESGKVCFLINAYSEDRGSFTDDIFESHIVYSVSYDNQKYIVRAGIDGNYLFSADAPDEIPVWHWD